MNEEPTPPPRKRRPRYSGKHPRRYDQKYKEHRGDPETLAKVMASGKTPAGSHRPIMVAEVLEVLRPQPGELVVDCTLGRGGHTRELFRAVQPGGRLLAFDTDPIELVKTEAQLRAEGFQPEALVVVHSNFAGLLKVLNNRGLSGADCILADLGVSSMQLDDPSRGFSVKLEGPLDMRMNPGKGIGAAEFLEKIPARELEEILTSNADEPAAKELAHALAGKRFETTLELAGAVRAAWDSIPKSRDAEVEDTIRRVFQAVRIAVNQEFTALDAFLRNLPFCLNPRGRVAVLTFHSGEDRRIKHAFKSGLSDGVYAEVSREVIRPTPAEQHANPRSKSAKLRWAIRA